MRMSGAIEKLLTTQEVAALLGLNASSLSRYRSTGTGPRFYSLTPKTPRYRASDVEQWLAEQCARGAAA